jgi:hypothetical protein
MVLIILDAQALTTNIALAARIRRISPNLDNLIVFDPHLEPT